MTDQNQAEIMYPNQQGGSDPGTWRIELKYLPIGHRGHAFLALVDDKGRVAGELHGLAYSKHAPTKRPREPMTIGVDDSDLVATHFGGLKYGGKPISTVGSGSREEMEKLWAGGIQAAEAINSQKFDYKSHDPAYEFGGRGGEIQNSNSVAFTLGKAMGLDLSGALRDAGKTRTFSGWDRDLLDPKYKRYVAPPVFPVKDAP
jgi:hypothetical protein